MLHGLIQMSKLMSIPKEHNHFIVPQAREVFPPVHAQQSGCDDYCEAMQCSFGGEICSSGCYDGMWTYCVEPAPGDDGGDDQEAGP
jgi:hypothetical protein